MCVYIILGAMNMGRGFNDMGYVSNEPVFVFEFDSNAIRTCIYSLMPFTARQRFHRVIARNLEKTL